jgi:hypothetical protein
VSKLQSKPLAELEIEDEPAFKHIEAYRELKRVLLDAKYTFRTLPEEGNARWDRALFLNLTFWSPEAGGDILSEDSIPADVVAHVAWHYLAARALADGKMPSTEALLLGESIASAFDLYLVGRTLGRPNASSFLESQVPKMADVAAGAGLEDSDFEAMLSSVAEDPERAFEDLRELLFDASLALHACADAEAAYATLERFASHRFGALLHHYELSNWVLYTRAYASREPNAGAKALEIDATLRKEKVALDWLAKSWF